MDTEFWLMLLKIIVFLPFVLFLIFASLKYGGNKLQNIQNGKFVRVLDRTAISKENSLLVVKVGEKGYLMSSTNGKVEIMFELNQEELKKIEAVKIVPKFNSLKDAYEKVFRKKEDNNE